MASTDQQPRQDLHGEPAAQKVKEIADKAGVALFVTEVSRFPTDARPMSLRGVDADGSCWFLSATDSDKNRDIERDPRVSLMFSDPSNYSFLTLSGVASIHTDRATIERHWTALANAWFKGQDDPRVSVIRVRPQQGHYWQSRNGKLVVGIKMALGALGADMDDVGVDGALTF